MTDSEAQACIDSCVLSKIDYLKGRTMKVRLDSDSFCPKLFNRDNGDGAAEVAIDKLREDESSSAT